MDDTYFWRTIDLLISLECKRCNTDLKKDAEDWANNLVGNQFLIRKDNQRDFHMVILGCDRSDYEEDDINLSHPHVRSKLEKLMGSNVVSLTDREYMIELQSRILDDYAQSMNKRIVVRQAEEMERVKNLVLTGKIPLDQAPPEMADHPVMLIDQYCKKVMAERRAKIKVLKPYIPKYLYWDDTPDPPSGLSIESGHVLRECNDRLCVPPDVFLATDEEQNIEDGYMYTDEEYEKMKYESALIKELRECNTVEEMYMLADQIIGILKTLAEPTSGKVESTENK